MKALLMFQEIYHMKVKQVLVMTFLKMSTFTLKLSTNRSNVLFSSQQRNSDGTLTSNGAAFGINGKGEFAIPFDKSLAIQKTDADSYLRQYARSAPHSTGEHTRGDIVWNTFPSAGGNVGWVCTATGTPGTWKEFGTIAP